MIDAQVHLELQQRVLEFVKQHNIQTDVAYRSLALMSEVSELAKEVLKATDYGTKPFLPNTDWADELGDIFFTIIILVNNTGIALDTALERVLAKYTERLMTKGTPGNAWVRTMSETYFLKPVVPARLRLLFST